MNEQYSAMRSNVSMLGKLLGDTIKDALGENILERVDGRNVPYFWLGFSRVLSNPPEGTDLRAIYDGRISVTPLHLNLTEEKARQALAPAMNGEASALLKE